MVSCFARGVSGLKDFAVVKEDQEYMRFTDQPWLLESLRTVPYRENYTVLTVSLPSTR